jgi:hypothetical protein
MANVVPGSSTLCILSEFRAAGRSVFVKVRIDRLGGKGDNAVVYLDFLGAASAAARSKSVVKKTLKAVTAT